MYDENEKHTLKDIMNTNYPPDSQKNKLIENYFLNDQSKKKTEANELDEAHCDEESKNSNSSLIPTKNKPLNKDKMNKMILDDKGGNDNIKNLKKRIEQSLKSDSISNKEIEPPKDRFIQINTLKKNSNSPFNEKEIKNFIKDIELKNKKISSGKINLDSSGDIIDFGEKYNLMGNKERKKTGKLINQQANSTKTTGFTSKNPGSINSEKNQEVKQLELNNEIKSQKYQNELLEKTIICCIKNIKMYINERAKLLYNIHLHYNYIQQLYEIDINNLEKYLELTIMDIYYGKYCMLNDEKDKKNVEYLIAFLLRLEKKNKINKFKLLNELFNLKLNEILLLYINDYPYLLIKKKNKKNATFYLKGFNTFKDDFQEINVKEKEEMENYIRSLDKNIDNKNEIEESDEQQESDEQYENEESDEQNENEESDEQNEEEESDEQNEEEESDEQNENEELLREAVESPNNEDLNNKFNILKKNNIYCSKR